MENYRVVLGAAEATNHIELYMEAASLASLVVKIMTLCRQLEEATGTEYDLEVLEKIW